MNTIKDGGPVHPCDRIAVGRNALTSSTGISLRDHFAGLAMQGWISALSQESLDELDDAGATVFREHADCVADAAFAYADAMIRAREVTA